MKAIPRILVRIDRGEDWVEMCADWQHDPPVCGEGNTEDWCDLKLVHDAYLKLNEAVIQ